MNTLNKKLSALLLSGILGAMALPAFAGSDTDAPSTPGPTTPTTPEDTNPMNPADDGEGIPPVQGPKTDGNPGGGRGGSGDGTGSDGSGSGSGSGAGS